MSEVEKPLDILKKICYNNYSKKRKEVHKMADIKRGQIYYADLSPVIGSEQGGTRPVLIIQNDVGNKHSPTTIIAIVTSRHTKSKLPTHYWISDKWQTSGLKYESMVELEQIRTIDKKRLEEYIGYLDPQEMAEISQKIRISLNV